MKKLTLLIALIILTSCKTQLVKNYQVSVGKTNYYTEQIYLDYANDSIFFVEFNRNGEIRRNGAFRISEVIIKEK